MPPAPLYLQTLRRYTNPILFIIIITIAVDADLNFTCTSAASKIIPSYCGNEENRHTLIGGAENAGVENAGVENTGAETYGKPSIQKFLMDVARTRNTFCGTWYLPHSRVPKSILNCAHSNRIPYPLFCSCCDVHVLLKNIK